MTMTRNAPQGPRFNGKPRVVVTRRLMPRVEAWLCELFDARLNASDAPMSREALAEAMREADVLVPTVTDRIDAEMIASASGRLKLAGSN
jgi:glyoxylate reductase